MKKPLKRHYPKSTPSPATLKKQQALLNELYGNKDKKKPADTAK